MPVPAFTIDGVLPPYVGANGPGGSPEDMTPYEVSPSEVVTALGDTGQRRGILRNWLNHRQHMRALGITRGFQWLDGSFVEDKQPRDLDVVTFMWRPPVAQSAQEIQQLILKNPDALHRPNVKALYNLDFLLVDLNGGPEIIVYATRYFCGLFSHRRGDDLWKGMLQVRLEDVQDDAEALAILNAADVNEPGGERML